MNTSFRTSLFTLFAMAFSLSEVAFAARLSVLFGAASSNTKESVRMFVTSTTYNGNLGGIAGADAKCQARADAASLGGTWKAIISDSTTNAKNRMIKRTKPVFNLAGQLIWNPVVPLMFSSDSGSATGAPPWGAAVFLANAPEITELGTSSTAYAWTGTVSTGLVYTALHCSNWTTTSGNAGFGAPSTAVSTWILQGSTSCAANYHLYCLEDE